MELIVVMVILVIIATTGFTVSAGRIVSNDLSTKVHEITYNLKLVQMRSITRYKNDTWGLYFNAAGRTFTIYKGASYATRTTSYDLVLSMPTDLSFGAITLNGGGSEIVFDKLTGKTAKYGTIVITPNQGTALTISVNALGVIDIN